MKPLLIDYTDTEMVGDLDTKRSTSRFIITFVCGVGSLGYKSVLYCPQLRPSLLLLLKLARKCYG